MSDALAVSDASPLIVFRQIERLDLIGTVLRQVVIPPAVASEISPSFSELPNWIRVNTVPTIRSSTPWWLSLDRGEIEAIALAIELSAGQILLDDRPARRAAKQLGLSVAGSLGLLLEAYRLGLIESVRPDLDAMIEVGFHAGSTLYEEVLGLAREIEQERG